MTEPVGPGEGCKICGNNEVDHKTMEKLGQLHHQWSSDGQLKRSEPQSKQRASTQQPTVIMVPGIDLPLRELLRQRGVLTDEDIAALGSFGPSPARDGDAGPAEATH